MDIVLAENTDGDAMIVDWGAEAYASDDDPRCALWPTELPWPVGSGLKLPNAPVCSLCGYVCKEECNMPPWRCIVVKSTMEGLVGRLAVKRPSALYTIDVGDSEPPARMGPIITGSTIRVIFVCGRPSCTKQAERGALRLIHEASSLLAILGSSD
jgi:hypothetical protein